MNERIRELAEQAKKHALDAMIKITDKEQALKVYSETYDTKFAELIVKECAELTLDYKSDDYYNGWLDYRDEIKEHFGVEE
jgi:hypothetical protein